LSIYHAVFTAAPSRMNPYPLVLIYLKGKYQRRPVVIQEVCVTEMSERFK